MLMAQAVVIVKGIEHLVWVNYGLRMLALFGLAILMGMMTAVPLGPVGAAGVLYMMMGKRRSAKACAYGCLAAELVIVLVAVGMGWYFRDFLGRPAPALELMVGLVVACFGGYLLVKPQLPDLGVKLSGILSFKITLLSPNNLAGVVALMAFLGITRRLEGWDDVLIVVVGHVLGLALTWTLALLFGRWMRKSGRAENALPWLVRGVAVVLLLAGLALVAKVALIDRSAPKETVPVVELIEQI